MPERRLRRTSIAIVVLASVVAFFAVFAVWAKRQVLETDTWTETSTDLLADPNVQTALNDFLVDRLFTEVDVEEKLRRALPDDASGLAAPASGGLRQLATTAGLQALQNPRVQALWADANRTAHGAFLSLIHGGGTAVSTEGGTVTLNLGEIVSQIGQEAGVDVSEKLPPEAAQIEVLDSDQLGFAQDVVNLLEELAIALPLLALALYGLAIYLPRGWRREALRACGFGFIVVGIVALLARSIAGGIVVDALAKTESVRPAAESTWSIATSLLTAGAGAMIAYGIAIVIGAWLAGRTAPARELRRELTPLLSERRWGYTVLAAIVILVFWLNPTEGTSRLVPSLILIALLIAGFEALRHQARHDFPEETWQRGTERWKARYGKLRERVGRRRRAPEAAQEAIASDARLEALERLGRLRESGVLEPAEFEREKERILAA